MSEWSAIKIPHDVPLEVAALLGCAVPTGWGSAVNAAQVRPGDVVIVVGIGGIGISAAQGAKHAGASRIVAVDPVGLKRTAALDFGATDAFADHAEAVELAASLTNGQGADAEIICVGVVSPDHVAAGVSAIRKGGTLVVTAAGSEAVTPVPLSLLELTMFQKRIQGAIYGMMAASKDVPRLLGLWRNGQLRLEEMLTRSYSLDDINQGYAESKIAVGVPPTIVVRQLPRPFRVAVAGDGQAASGRGSRVTLWPRRSSWWISRRR